VLGLGWNTEHITHKEEDMGEVAGRVVIVVGASGGIGRIISREFHNEGATVVLVARKVPKLEELANQLGNKRTKVIPTDASVPADVERLFAETVKMFGKVDAVVISTGNWSPVSIDTDLKEAVEQAEQDFRAHFLTVYTVGLCAQRFFRKQSFGGLIVNISSHVADRANLVGNLSYGSAKAAASRFLNGIRFEIFNETNRIRHDEESDTFVPRIRVTEIKPAIVNTHDNKHLLPTKEMRDLAVQPEEISGWIIKHFNDVKLPVCKSFTSEVTV